MQLHELKTHARKKVQRVGRGGRRGKTSGRGGKGQTARAGRPPRPAIRDVIKKIPKKRGYRFNARNPRMIAINLSSLETAFSDGDIVTKESLETRKLIRRHGGRVPHVKVLGTGAVSKKIIISGLSISKSARAKVEKAGGTIE